jgi:hypothetical protein
MSSTNSLISALRINFPDVENEKKLCTTCRYFLLLSVPSSTGDMGIPVKAVGLYKSQYLTLCRNEEN